MSPEGPLPGVPGGWRGAVAIVLLATIVVVADHMFLQSAIFSNQGWNMLRWAIALVGLIVGLLAYTGVVR